MPGVDFHLAVHARSRAHASALHAVAVGSDRPEYGPIQTDRVFRIPEQRAETENLWVLRRVKRRG